MRIALLARSRDMPGFPRSGHILCVALAVFVRSPEDLISYSCCLEQLYKHTLVLFWIVQVHMHIHTCLLVVA